MSSASKSFVKKTKAGRVMKVVREHYLRDDIFCGCELAAPEHRGPDQAGGSLTTTTRTQHTEPSTTNL
jgi:exosome complex exonuclease DIS3/RRP44